MRTATLGCCEVTPEERVAVAEAKDEAGRLADLFKALSDGTRVRIVQRLLQSRQPICECHLVELFDLSQPTINYHLKVLREAGIVESDKRGVWSYYWVSPRAMLELVRSLTELG
ncbi:MAG: winged helix-turn-helix transcriptional regulator [Chloroflexi bacterium]|nr:winged helix-turn-helix transcriptional regulator [Chloroflexota bacterium]